MKQVLVLVAQVTHGLQQPSSIATCLHRREACIAVSIGSISEDPAGRSPLLAPMHAEHVPGDAIGIAAEARGLSNAQTAHDAGNEGPLGEFVTVITAADPTPEVGMDCHPMASQELSPGRSVTASPREQEFALGDTGQGCIGTDAIRMGRWNCARPHRGTNQYKPRTSIVRH